MVVWDNVDKQMRRITMGVGRNFCGWRKRSVFWSKRWFHRCMHMSKCITLYIFKMCILLYGNYISEKMLQKVIASMSFYNPLIYQLWIYNYTYTRTLQYNRPTKLIRNIKASQIHIRVFFFKILKHQSENRAAQMKWSKAYWKDWVV